MTTTAPIRSTPARPRAVRTIGVLAVAVVAAVAVNAAIAAAAVAFRAPSGYGPLTPPAFTLFTVIGVVVGWFGWVIVQRRAHDPRRVLTILVPAVTLVSLVPDVLLLVTRFVPGTTATAAVALMLMHLAVVAIAVPAYAMASRDSARGASER